MSKKAKVLDYLLEERQREIEVLYEHEISFYSSLGADEDFNIICSPMPDGSELDDDEKAEIVYTCIKNNVDLVYQLGIENGDMVTFVVNPETMEIKENSKSGYIPSTKFEFHG